MAFGWTNAEFQEFIVATHYITKKPLKQNLNEKVIFYPGSFCVLYS